MQPSALRNGEKETETEQNKTRTVPLTHSLAHSNPSRPFYFPTIPQFPILSFPSLPSPPSHFFFYLFTYFILALTLIVYIHFAQYPLFTLQCSAACLPLPYTRPATLRYPCPVLRAGSTPENYPHYPTPRPGDRVLRHSLALLIRLLPSTTATIAVLPLTYLATSHLVH